MLITRITRRKQIGRKFRRKKGLSDECRCHLKPLITLKVTHQRNDREQLWRSKKSLRGSKVYRIYLIRKSLISSWERPITRWINQISLIQSNNRVKIRHLGLRNFSINSSLSEIEWIQSVTYSSKKCRSMYNRWISRVKLFGKLCPNWSLRTWKSSHFESSSVVWRRHAKAWSKQ